MQRFILALLWGLFLAAGAGAQQLPANTQFAGCVTGLDASFTTGAFGRLRCDSQGNLLTTGGGGGGGTSGPYYVGQYNSTLPTFAAGQAGYIALDSNGRVIQSPGASVTQGTSPWVVGGTVTANQGTSPWNVSGSVTATLNQGGSALSTGNPIFAQITNFPGTQPVSNAGTFAVQNTAAIPAGSNNIGSLTNITGTVSLPTGASTAANQTSEITALNTANQRSAYSQDFSATSVAANSNAVGVARDAGASPSQWNWISFNGTATVTGGTFYLQASSDNFGTSFVTVATVTVATASAAQNATTVPYTMQDRVRYRYYRVVYQNGANAGTITGGSALTVN